MQAERTAASFEYRSPMGNGARERQPLAGKFTVAHMTDESLRRLAKQHRRDLEDIADGDSKQSKRAVKAWLRDIEAEQEMRAVLRECWQAEPFGSDSTADFMREGGKLVMLTEHGPSYRIAILFDRERHLRGESTVLAWEAA